MPIILKKERFNGYGDYYWEWNGIVIEPPDSIFEWWEISGAGDDGFEVFDTVEEVKEYLKKKTGKSGIILSGLKEVLKNIDALEEEEREEEEMALTTVQNGRYEEVGRFPSKSRPGEFYIVKLDSTTGDYTCNCNPWIYNKRKDRTCSHTDKLVGNKREVQYDRVRQSKDDAERELLEMRQKVKMSEKSSDVQKPLYRPFALSPKVAPSILPTPTRTNDNTKKVNPRRRRLMLDD